MSALQQQGQGGIVQRSRDREGAWRREFSVAVPVGGSAWSALVGLVLLNGGAEPVILFGIELFVSAAILIRLVPKLH